MLTRQTPIPRWKTLLGTLTLMLAVATFTPTISHAIPVAGDYLFTDGLAGSFTSDGTKLTTWFFGIKGTVDTKWADRPASPPFVEHNDSRPASPPLVEHNDSRFFYARDILSGNDLITIKWDTNSYSFVRVNGPDIIASSSGLITYRATSLVPGPPSQVPELSTMPLLALGLLALLGPMRQQWRQAGLQVR